MAIAPDQSVDMVARSIAIAALLVSLGRLAWEVAKHQILGQQVLRNSVTTSDEPRALIVTTTNDGRRPVFVREARLRYDLGGQELVVAMPNSRGTHDDTVLQPHGHSIQFTCTFNANLVLSARTAFQDDPTTFYVTVESMGGILATIGNDDIQPLLRHLLNEFDPPIP